MATPYRRKVFLINKPFQWRMAVYVCSWVAALSFIYPMIISNLFDFFIRYAELDPTGPNLASIKQTRKDILVLLMVLQGTFFLLTLLVSLFLAHRIAGPIYKIKLLLGKIKGGDLSEELHLRKYDHFKDLGDEYNAMLAALRSRNGAVLQHIEAAKAHTNEKGNLELDNALKAMSGLTSP